MNQFKTTFLTTLFFIAILCIGFEAKSQTLQVLEEGTAGHTTGQMLNRISTSVFANNPTTTIVLGGTNDFTNIGKLNSVSVFETNMRSIVDQIIADGGDLILMTIPPVIESIFLVGKDQSLWTDGPNNLIIQGNEVLKQIAVEKNIVLVDLYDLFNTTPSLISSDGVHQTEAGSQAMADLLYDVFVDKGFSTTKIICFGDSITNRYPSFLYDTLLPLVGPQTVGNTFTVGDYSYIVTATSPNEIKSTGSTATGNFSIPASATDSSTSTTYNLTEIGKDVFLSNANIGDVVVPEGVIILGENAFNSSSVTSVTLPNSLKTIGFRTFRGTGNLTSVTLPNALTTIGSQVWHSSGLTDLVFPSSVTAVGTHTFYSSGNLVSVTLGSSMPAITNRMFYQTQVKELTVPASITSFDEGSWTGSGITKLMVEGTTPAIINAAWAGTAANITAYVPTASVAVYKAASIWKDMIIVGNTFTVDDFSYKITSINPNEVQLTASTATGNFSIPASVTYSETSTTFNLTEIGKNVFLSNTSIGDVVVPEGVITLGENAFNSSSLTSVMLPNSLTTIVFRAFRGTSNLTALTIPNSVTTIGDQVWHSSGLTDIVFSNSVTSVGTHTFYSSGNLATATLGSSMPAITNRMFYNTKVAELTLPASITSFDEGSWTGSSITKLIVEGTTPAIINAAWSGTAANITAYVPTASVTAYKAAPIWGNMTILDATTLSTTSLKQGLDFSLYPNPSNGIISVKGKDLTNADVTVLDVNGRVLLKTKKTQFNISNLASGVYLIRVKSGNSESVKRFIKR
jgi:lysophospholipase L1-like esterase